MKYPTELANTMGKARIGISAVVVYCLFLCGAVSLVAPVDPAAAGGAAVGMRDQDIKEVLLRMGALEVSQSKLEVGFGFFLAAFAALNTLIVVFFALNFRETAILAAELEARKVLKDERSAIEATINKVIADLEKHGADLKAQLTKKADEIDLGPVATKVMGDKSVEKDAKAGISQQRGGRKKT